MKNHLISPMMLVGSAALSSLLLASSTCVADENPVSSEAKEPRPQSVFQIPGPGFPGRDPFYPNSSRVSREAIPVVTQAPAHADLVLKAISGTAARPLAMINGVTFEIGEEREVRTIQGRVRVRLMSVQGLKVTIAVGNQTRELELPDYNSDSATTLPPADSTGPSTNAETAQLGVPGRI
jgi:hypothetical protein